MRQLAQQLALTRIELLAKHLTVCKCRKSTVIMASICVCTPESSVVVTRYVDERFLTTQGCLTDYGDNIVFYKLRKRAGLSVAYATALIILDIGALF